MAGEAINLANVMTRVQFAQDAYAIFQAVDHSAREELNARRKAHVVLAEKQIQEIKHVEGETAHKINEDGRRGRNFEESLDQARKRLAEHKKDEEEEEFDTPEDGKNFDVIV